MIIGELSNGLVVAAPAGLVFQCGGSSGTIVKFYTRMKPSAKVFTVFTIDSYIYGVTINV